VVRVAGRVDEYRELLRAAPEWEPVLLARSGLPGPRANLELAQVAAAEAPPERLRAWAASEHEYLALVGTIGLAGLGALREQANDPRRRVREGVAMALQRLGFDAVLPAMREWAKGSLLERRAVVGGLCEPALLDERRGTIVLGLLDEITAGIADIEDRRRDEDRDVAWIMRENLKKKRLQGIL
jgi:hypothetical protein